MPLDPTISLGVQVPSGAPGGGNPAGAASSWMDVISKMNQNQLFQQTFQAKQQAGQIISSAPDMETGLQNLFKNPSTAAFAPAIVNDIKAQQLSMSKMGMEMGQSVLQGALKMMVGAYDQPELLPALKDAALAAMPPEVKKQYAPIIEDLTRSLVSGMSDAGGDPKALQFNRDLLNRRLIGMGQAGGVSPEALRALTGQMAPAMPFEPTGPGGAGQFNPIGGSMLPPRAGAGAAPPAGVAPVAGGASTVLAPIPDFTGRKAFGHEGAAYAPAGAAPVPAPAGAGVNALAPPGGGGPSAMGQSISQQEFQKKRTDAAVEDINKVHADVAAGRENMQYIDEARRALAEFKAGGGAEVYSRLAGLAQALGGDNVMLPSGEKDSSGKPVMKTLTDLVGNGNQAATQEFSKLMVNGVMSQIRQTLPAGSMLNRNEWNAFEQRGTPSISMDPRAIEKIFEFQQKLYERNYDQQQSMTSWLKDPKNDPMDWRAHWEKVAREKGYTTSATATGEPFGRLRSLPAAAAPSGATARELEYDPKTKTIRPVK